MGVQLVTPESIGTFVAVAAGTTPPSSAPVLSLTSYTATTIDVSCTSVSGATGYKFYKDGVLVATQAGTTYQYAGLTTFTSYALTCKAYNGAGDSSVSNTVTQAPTYPSVSGSLLWVDFINRAFTDTSGTTPATDGNAIWTVSLPSGWGASFGDGLVRQDTSGNRPTYRAAGAQGNGTSTIMSLPSTIMLGSTFTAWYVVDFNGAYNQPATGLAGTDGFGGALCNYNISGLRAFDNTATYIQTLATTPSGKTVARIRRDASNNIYFKSTGLAEAAKSSTTYTWPISRVLSYPSIFNSSSNRSMAIILVSTDAVTAGTNTAIENFINTVYGASV